MRREKFVVMTPTKITKVCVEVYVTVIKGSFGNQQPPLATHAHFKLFSSEMCSGHFSSISNAKTLDLVFGNNTLYGCTAPAN